MNNKVLAAFLGGLIVASGVTYLLMWRPEPKPVAQVAAVQTPVAPAPTPEPKPAEAEAPAPVVQEPVKPAPAVRAPVRPVPASRGRVTAPSTPVPQAETPRPAAPAPEPTPEPVRTASSEPPRAVNPVSAPALPPPPKEEPKPNTVTIAAGTTLAVRLAETIASDRNRVGDNFTATLDQPLVVDGFVIAERGSRAQGKVVQSEEAGRVKGLAQLGIEITQITTSDGQKVRVNTSPYQKQAENTRKKDAAKVGIGAALGAAIGAIAGGGKGAGIGAGVGGAAGAGDVLLTRGKAVELPVETKLSFRLAEAVTITEKLR